jgi:hypothetical protein
MFEETTLSSIGLYYEIRGFIYLLATNSEIYSETLEQKKNCLLTAYGESYDLYDQVFDDSINELTEIIKIVCSLTGVLFVIMYVVYYLPLISRLENMVIDTTKMIKLVPQEMLMYNSTADDISDNRKTSTNLSVVTN